MHPVLCTEMAANNGPFSYIEVTSTKLIDKSADFPFGVTTPAFPLLLTLVHLHGILKANFVSPFFSYRLTFHY